MAKYDLNRYISAQNGIYEQALEEIKSGYKQTHWMWFIFPQHKELGYSYMAKYYGISDIQEAKQYLENEILSNRLKEISTVLLTQTNKAAEEIFGTLDAMKLKSSMTLFDYVCPNDIFQEVLNHFFNGNKDLKTIELLENKNS